MKGRLLVASYSLFPGIHTESPLQEVLCKRAPFIPNSASPKLRSVDLNSDCCASIDLVVRFAAAAVFLARDNCRCRTRVRKRPCLSHTLSYVLQSIQLVVGRLRATPPWSKVLRQGSARSYLASTDNQHVCYRNRCNHSSKPPREIFVSRPMLVQDRNARCQLGHPVHTFQQ